jgi:hypothetical protein
MILIQTENLNRLKMLALIFTFLGIGVFVYFVYSVGINEILDGIGKIGFAGFAIILFVYFLRITVRAIAWKLSVYEPYRLNYSDTFQAVIMGEAVSSVIPLGILASGTSKAVAVSNRIPFVAALSSVATENLFYSLITSLFIISGAIAFLANNSIENEWNWIIYVLIGFLLLVLTLGFLMVLRQWHLASELCNIIYNKGYFHKFLESGRLQVRLFENLIYGFYRQHPSRFFPIIICQIIYHLLGITEILFILSRISDVIPTFYSAFLLESMSRVITVAFKLIPFAIGVDEAGSQFISETLMLGAAVGITISILRKGRILFWAIVGALLIIKRGLSIRELLEKPQVD